MIYSNIVPEEKTREVQREALNIIARSLEKSFGPKGSVTTIVKDLGKNSPLVQVEHTKDGYTIIKNIMFYGSIERSVQNLVTDITWDVVKEVGDGTTSAVLLCNTLFNALCDNSALKNAMPADIMHKFHDTVTEINNKIMSLGRTASLDDIYNIALISTNNNEEVARNIKNIYEEFGMDVEIDVGISNDLNTIIRKYDGMVLDTPYSHMCMVNDKEHNKAIVDNPEIYCFEDAIDTPEMLALLNSILQNNIIKPYSDRNLDAVVPTVILCKHISQDTDSYFNTIVNLMNQIPNVPLLIVSDIHQEYLFQDIMQMTGAKIIKKYLDPKMQEEDIKRELAPTPETVSAFAGGAERVESDSTKTKIINPKLMFDDADHSTYSKEYYGYVNYLETKVQEAENNGGTVREKQEAKRRLSSFKGKMVDYLIGGITIADRNNLKGAVEDAVFNCRSASKNGVGYGANFMAFKVLHEMTNTLNSSKIFIDTLYKAYRNILSILYSTNTEDELNEIIDGMIKNDCPLNIRTNEYDHKVLSSIKSDTVILDAIDKILMQMFTCNQYLVQTPNHNTYVADKNE